jgi:hypothetical protein
MDLRLKRERRQHSEERKKKKEKEKKSHIPNRRTTSEARSPATIATIPFPNVAMVKVCDNQSFGKLCFNNKQQQITNQYHNYFDQIDKKMKIMQNTTNKGKQSLKRKVSFCE